MNPLKSFGIPLGIIGAVLLILMVSVVLFPLSAINDVMFLGLVGFAVVSFGYGIWLMIFPKKDD